MKKKGIFLIYVIFTAVLISVFLITAVNNLHNSFFLTRKFTGENKAYWAAEAGMQYCEYKLKSDLGWPFFNAQKNSNNNKETTEEKFGKFNITSQKDGNNGYYIYGKSENEAEEFHIYFSKKEAKSSEELISIVPDHFPNNKLSYCSYTSMKEEDLNRTINDERDINYSNLNFLVSTSPRHQAIITSPGIYIVSDGRSGIYKTVLEKMYVVDSNNKFGGGLYSGGNINIEIQGQKSNFRVSQTSNSQPEVYCKKDMTLTRTNPNGESKNSSFIKPCSIYGGTIYLGNHFEILDKIISNEAQTLDFAKNTIREIFEKYQEFKKDGTNLDQYTSSNDISFPKLTWNKITEIKNKTIKDDEDKHKIPSGTYVAIFEKDYDSYSLFRLNKDYKDENGEFKSKEFDADMEKARLMTLAQIEKVREDNTIDPEPYRNKRGRWVDPKPYLTQQGIQEIQALNTERGVILTLVSYLNGEEEVTIKHEGKDVTLGTEGDTGIIASESTESQLFAIKTIGVENKNIEEIKKKKKDDEKVSKWSGTPTPIITLKDSVETEETKIKDDKGNSINKNFFNLITLVGNVDIEEEEHTYTDENDVTQTHCETKINNIEFHIAEDTPTDLVFKKKNNGISERKTMLEYNGEEQEYSGLVSGKESVMLYSEGPILINGKLSGNGQILSGENVYFKAGTQLNAKDSFTEEDLNSKLGIYSKGKVTMKEPDSIGSFDQLHESIKNSLLKLQGKEYEYYNFIVDTILRDTVPVTQEAKSKIDSRLADKAPESTSLTKLMKDFYGFSERESRDYLEEIVSKNLVYNKKNDRYKLADELKITSKNPSSFSGVIYSCGGFECNAGNNDVTINGILCTYGATNPDNDEPGSGTGYSFDFSDKCLEGNPGGIEIKNCKNFSVVYNSTDLSDFLEICSGEKLPINLSCIYCNRL